MLGRHHGFPSLLFLDGTSYQPLFGRNDPPGVERRWLPADPAGMVFTEDDMIGYWDVASDAREIVVRLGDGYSDFHIGPWEGDLSRDGRFVAVVGQKGGRHVAFAYDLHARRKHPDLVLDGIGVDWVSVSASGRYIVLNGAVDGGGSDQTRVFDLDGRPVGKPWSESGRPSHYDLTLDGSLEVERIAHLHAGAGDYLMQAHAVPSPGGERVLWASAWGAAGGRPVAAYVAVRPGSTD